ncbi:uncharacterized protein [Blastocystis hominis]|uniref:Uncharacterized protein n=1 Tax=Blastocystis hominis TaxID=12968 RepID=D8M8Y6_BLAHO|nr:uncharacterized protein [Blastocystis hominis]CBK24525.2 unnamed protein product [Blastocystis hominis]|eukprot:XP_012898573.1 uncharacterized protein [Blastocystis hominis]
MSKRSYLPVSHISKALCTRDNGDFLLKDEEGRVHRFSDERDIIIPYSIAEPYLTRCKKQCRCVEIDPEVAPSTPSNMGNMVKRRSVFSVIGEMDHGKTTLLDTFLHTSYQKQEFGGTTQIIRANDMQIPYKTASGETALHPCTFLDTPGQSCFSFIRENGSILSDLALYIVSLYEGPSEEARSIFQQMKENKTPVIVVFTKSDLVSNLRRESVKQSILELAASFHVPICFCVTHEGIEQLQQRLVELGQRQQPSVPIDCPAEATVLDSLVIPSQGIVFRALVQQGCLSLRNNFICGMYTGRVRNLIDLHSNPVQKALPGMVVNVLGARKLPAFLRKKPQLLPAGDTLFVRTPDEIKAIWDQRLLEFSFRASAGRGFE